jgi:hypothetical protein
VAHLTYRGAPRSRKLQEVRSLSEFRVSGARTRVELYEVWSDPETRLAWIECYNGTFRLPARMFAWAESVEDQAQQVIRFGETFPCWTVFEEDSSTGEIMVEIFPRGYRSPFR